MFTEELVARQGLIFAGAYFFLSGFIYLLLRLTEKKWSHFRIDKKPAGAFQLQREIMFSVVTLMIFTAFGALTLWLYRQGFTKMYEAVEEHGLLYIVISFFLSLLLHDFYFYWTHRFMHLPGIYRLIHRTHHLSQHTTVLSALSFHPGEAVIQAAFIPLITLVLPLHPVALYGFVFYNLLVNILGHSGYDFFPEWFKRSLPGKISNTPVYHYIHHRMVKKNYGLYLNIWDRLMGTAFKDTSQAFNHSTTKHRPNPHESDPGSTELY